jgi:hypothetical protein
LPLRELLPILGAFAKDFQEGAAQAIAKVRKEQSLAYVKICALLVPPPPTPMTAS